MGTVGRRAAELIRGPNGFVVRAGVSMIVVVVGLSGCTLTTAGQQGSHDYGTEALPIAVAGLEECSGLEGGAVQVDGDSLPELSLPCLNQETELNLAELGGRPLVINLWASWCGPCRNEMPLLAEGAKRNAGVSFLGVNTRDDPDLAAAFLPEVGATYPQVVDVEGALLDSTRVRGLPVTLAVDAAGRIVDRVIGEISEDELNRLLNRLKLAESAAGP